MPFIKRENVPSDKQYNIVASFTPATAENINEITRVIFSEMYQRKNKLDEYIKKVPNMILFSQDYFQLDSMGSNLLVGRGSCLIDEVFIQSGNISLDLNEIKNYLIYGDSYDEDRLYEIAICFSYHRSYETGVIGIITEKHYDTLEEFRDIYLILGFATVNVQNKLVVDVEEIYFDSNMRMLSRDDFAISYFDGGRVIPHSEEHMYYNIIFEGGIEIGIENTRPNYENEYDGINADEDDYPEVTIECGNISTMRIADQTPPPPVGS